MIVPLPGWILWLLIWAFLLGVLGWVRGDLLERGWAKLLFFPGLVLDALLRLPACLLSGTEIQRWSPLRGGRPFLETGETTLGVAGRAVGVVVRLIGIYALTFWVVDSYPGAVPTAFALPDIAHEAPQPVSTEGLHDMFWGLLAIPTALLDADPWRLLLLYSLFTAIVAVSIERRELGGAILAMVLLGLATQVTAWLGVRFGWFSRGWFIQHWYGWGLWCTFSLLVFLTVLSLAVLGFASGVRRLTARLARGRAS